MTRRVNKFVIKVGRHKNNEDQYQNEDDRELDLVEHEKPLLSDLTPYFLQRAATSASNENDPAPRSVSAIMIAK